MRIAIVGASGRSGRAAVGHALERGHEVVAVVRNASSAPGGTEVALADARDRLALAAAIEGADAVISAIGHVTHDDDVSVLRDGAAALASAMSERNVRRLVAVSAAGAYVVGDDPLSRFVAKPILERALKQNNIDTRAMEEVIRAADLDWTILRPSRLVHGAGAQNYRRRVDLNVRWHYQTRFDTVGRAAVDALETPEWIGHAIAITG